MKTNPYATMTRLSPSPNWIAAFVFAGSIGFALLQNRFGLTGGPISAAKTLWLSFTLQIFFVAPFCLWRNTAYSLAVRRMYGAVFVSFAIRAVVELYILYFTRAWKCGYGITHDLFTFLLVTIFCLSFWMRRVPLHAGDRRALIFVPLLLVTLVVECFMAWQFSLLASPAEGIYFADNTEHFRRVNLWSWIAVGIGYPALLAFLWHARKDFCYESKASEFPGAVHV